MILSRENPPPSPPLPSNASLERMIDVLTLHYFPFPNETLTYCSTDSATRQIKKSNVDKKKKKSLKIKQLLLSVTYASQHLSNLGTMTTGRVFFFFNNFVQTFVWNF